MNPFNHPYAIIVVLFLAMATLLLGFGYAIYAMTKNPEEKTPVRRHKKQRPHAPTEVTVTHLPNWIQFFNLPKYICQHVIGQNHTWAHRIVTGLMIATFDGVLVHIQIEYFALKLMADTVGFMIHAIGAVPVIEFYSQEAA